MRPSKNTDKQLLLAARELLMEKGSMDIGMREVAAKAGVNMGMFYYHFKDKDDFWCHLLQEFYEEFFSDFQIDASSSDSAIDNLRAAALYIGNFAVKHRVLVSALFLAGANGDEAVRKFFKKNFVRHLRIIVDLIKRGQKEDKLVSLPPLTILVMLMGAINAPTFVFHSFSKNPFGVAKMRMMGASRESILSAEAVSERVEIMISALKKRERK